jgi:hypothetical protein
MLPPQKTFSLRESYRLKAEVQPRVIFHESATQAAPGRKNSGTELLKMTSFSLFWFI